MDVRVNVRGVNVRGAKEAVEEGGMCSGVMWQKGAKKKMSRRSGVRVAGRGGGGSRRVA